MANPQPTDAHIRIAHSITEQIMISDFSKRQRKILDLLLRLSWGCGKKAAIIPRQKDFEITGIAEGHIKQELVCLVNRKVIFIDGNQYFFNKDFDKWRVSISVKYTPEKLTELVRINLNGTYQNSKSSEKKLTELVSEETYQKGKNLDEKTYQKGKSSKAKSVPAKERGVEGRGKGTPPPPI